MTTALYTFMLAALAGLALLVAGVFMLAGPGWAMIAGACSLLVVAGFIRKGMTGG